MGDLGLARAAPCSRCRGRRRGPSGTSSCARRTAPGRRRGSTSAAGPRASYGVDGTTTLSPGHVGEERLDRLRVVERAVDAAAVRGADRHRHAVAVVRAVAHPRRLGHDLVERREDEVGELDLGDRPQAVDRRADRRADDHRFGQRRVDDPVVAELGPQPVGREEDAALLADVLAEHDDRLVAAHLVGERLADGLDERARRHQSGRRPGSSA